MTLLVDIAYTFHISIHSSMITSAELANLILIIMVVGGLWALENIAIIYAKESDKKKEGVNDGKEAGEEEGLRNE